MANDFQWCTMTFRLSGSWMILLGTANAHCSDPAEYRCESTNLDGIYEETGNDRLCLKSSMFAARDTAEIVPLQAEVDRYFERLARAADAEPIILRGGPQPYRAPLPGFAYLYTRNAAVIEAWQGLDDTIAPRTGDLTFDATIQDLTPTIWHAQVASTGEFYVQLGMAGVFNEEVLHERLGATWSRLEDRLDRTGQADSMWTWNDGTRSGTDTASAMLSVRLGWGDCIAGCRYFHELRAVIPPTGTATVFDLGGDPLPDGWELRPTTRPPP